MHYVERISGMVLAGWILWATFGGHRPPESDGSRWRDEIGRYW